MLPSKIKLIVFDFDGTLNNDKLRNYVTVRRMIARFRLDRYEITPLTIVDTRGVPPNARKGAKARVETLQFLKYWNPRAFPLWKRAWIYLNFEWEYARVGKQYLFLFPGVVDLMKDLHAVGYFLGIGTNRGSGTVKRQLKLTGILPFFAGIYGYNNCRRGKPDPEMIFRNIRAVRKKHKVEVRSPETLMVGDSLNEDIKAGSSAGACTAWITRIQQNLKEDLPLKPNLVIPDILALRKSLQKLERNE